MDSFGIASNDRFGFLCFQVYFCFIFQLRRLFSLLVKWPELWVSKEEGEEESERARGREKEKKEREKETLQALETSAESA